MKLAVISFTERGSRLNRFVQRAFEPGRHRGGEYGSGKDLRKAPGFTPLTTSLHDWTDENV